MMARKEKRRYSFLNIGREDLNLFSHVHTSLFNHTMLWLKIIST
jgi:hypothetical protein